MEFQSFGKIIVLAGVFLFVLGVLVFFAPKIPFLGKLPGDFHVKGGNFSFYFPLATSIIVSVILTLILNFLIRWK